MTAITLLQIPIKYRPLNVGHERMLHRPARFERRQNRVCVHRSALKNLVSQCIRQSVQDRSAPTSNRRLADTASADRRLRVRNIQRSPLHVDGYVKNRRRFTLVEAHGEHLAVARIEHPFLANRMADAERRTAEHLTAERSRMDHSADIGGGEEVDNVVLSSFDIDLDLGETGNIGIRRTIAWVVVLGGHHQALSGQRRDRRLRQFVDIGGGPMAIVDAAQFNYMFRCLRQRHAGATAFAENAFVRYHVLLRLAAKFLRRDFLKLLLSSHRRGVCCPRHGVRRLTSAGDAGERKISRRVAPDYVAFFPRHAENLRTRAMYIHHRLGSKVADSRLEGDASIRLDDEKPVESDRASDVTTQRNANAANFRAFPLRSACDPLVPLELLRATVKCFFQECAGGILAFSLHYWSQRRLALGAVDAADGYLVNSQLARRFRDDGLDNDNPL